MSAGTETLSQETRIVAFSEDSMVVVTKSDKLYLVRNSDWNAGGATLAVGMTLYVPTNALNPFEMECEVSGTRLSVCFALPNRTVIVKDTNESIYLNIGKNLGAFVANIRITYQAPLFTIRADGDGPISFFLPKDEPMRTEAERKLRTWLKQVNDEHRKRFYLESLVARRVSEENKTVVCFHDPNCTSLELDNSLLPDGASEIGKVVWVLKSTIYDELKRLEEEQQKSKESVVVLRYEHKEMCTEVTIGDKRVTLPVERDVHVLSVSRDNNGVISAKSTSFTYWKEDEIGAALDITGRVVVTCDKLRSIPFSILSRDVKNINEKHREHFYEECKVIGTRMEVSGAAYTVVTLLVDEGAIRTVDLEADDLPADSITPDATVWVRKDLLAVPDEPKIEIPEISHHEEKPKMSELLPRRREPGDTVVKIGEHCTFHWSNTRSLFVQHEAKVIWVNSKRTFDVMVNGDNGLSVSVYKSADKHHADEFAMKLNYELAKIDQERAAKHYAECEVVSVNLPERTAVVKRKSDGFRYNVKIDTIPEAWRVSQSFLVALTALVHLADPINCSKDDEKLRNLCLEARPDITHDELLIYSHASRIQREGKPYYVEAIMRHTEDGSGFEIQIGGHKWILKHSRNILRVYRVGTSLQLKAKNPNHIVYVEFGSHNFEVFSSSHLNDVAKARAFVERVVGEINSQLQSYNKMRIASKQLKRSTYDCFAGPHATGMSYDNNAVFTSLNRAFSKAASEKEVREYVPKILGGAGVCGNLYKEMVFESGTVMQIYPGCGKVVISCEGKPIERLSMAQVLMLDKEIACSTFSATDKCALSRHLGLMCAKADLCQICLCHSPGTPGFGFESCLCTDAADIERLAEHPGAIICCPCVKQAVQNYLYDSLLDEEASDDDLPPLELCAEDDEPEPVCTCEHICHGCGGASEASSSAASSKKPESYDLKVGPFKFSYYIDTRIFFAMGSSAHVDQIPKEHCPPSCSVYQGRLHFLINHVRMSFETPSMTGTEQLILAQKVGSWLLELYTLGAFK